MRALETSHPVDTDAASAMTLLSDDRWVAQRIPDHIDNRTTDVRPRTRRQPVRHNRSPQRLAAELEWLQEAIDGSVVSRGQRV